MPVGGAVRRAALRESIAARAARMREAKARIANRRLRQSVSKGAEATGHTIMTSGCIARLGVRIDQRKKYQIVERGLRLITPGKKGDKFLKLLPESKLRIAFGHGTQNSVAREWRCHERTVVRCRKSVAALCLEAQMRSVVRAIGEFAGSAVAGRPCGSLVASFSTLKFDETKETVSFFSHYLFVFSLSLALSRSKKKQHNKRSGEKGG